MHRTNQRSSAGYSPLANHHEEIPYRYTCGPGEGNHGDLWSISGGVCAESLRVRLMHFHLRLCASYFAFEQSNCSTALLKKADGNTKRSLSTQSQM